MAIMLWWADGVWPWATLCLDTTRLEQPTPIINARCSYNAVKGRWRLTLSYAIPVCRSDGQIRNKKKPFCMERYMKEWQLYVRATILTLNSPVCGADRYIFCIIKYMWKCQTFVRPIFYSITLPVCVAVLCNFSGLRDLCRDGSDLSDLHSIVP